MKVFWTLIALKLVTIDSSENYRSDISHILHGIPCTCFDSKLRGFSLFVYHNNCFQVWNVMKRNLALDVADALVDITAMGKSASIFVTIRNLVVVGLVDPLVPVRFTNAKVVLRDRN